MTAPRYISPLRYPGGKARMHAFLTGHFAAQDTVMGGCEIWIEPFAGGAGAGLTMLAHDAIEELWIADTNPGVAAIWQTLITDTAAFADRVATLNPTIEAYRAAQAALEAPEGLDTTDLALAAFLINRCSRSGIIHPSAGPIGGWRQTGRWTLRDRYNGEALAQRILYLEPFTRDRRIHLQDADAITLIQELDGALGIEDEVFVFADPPYIREGGRLYTNSFTEVDHQNLAAALGRCAAHWAVTYDDEPLLLNLYPDSSVLSFAARHRAQEHRVDQEYMIFSPRSENPPEDAAVLPDGGSHWVQRQGGVGAS